ncbi:2,4-dienoyl-CoA reductase-like NADH-dependent reductase (Old Yellow Enzyme family) [Robertmurraya andreesenii]|uniref:2,4-dienoyl-CoA reductase-like NADH-dependent reductase (Old Yellow Enzyme family) n=2 Tax=Anoxybacillus andreesenii TaxID=1325932 RepID=A0ABT9V6S2_9BACL|nr:NADH:flavin oxidoreductase [Robertmurraya andreesenii]MDQ0156633.1 2,4-dienoyl-CoA reductase-like NADH-dependent reductase (Old Yellow Enzyme family) [Robertmurraya andreesenii]
MDKEYAGHTLLQSVPFGNEMLASRLVMAPMTRMFSPNGVPGKNVAQYYRKRAENGIGLIITEGTAINHPAAVMSPDIPRFYGEDAFNGWANVVKEVHQAGGKIIPQLWHVGAARKAGSEPNIDAPPVSPSGFTLKGKRNEKIKALTNQEVTEMINTYAEAAANAKRIGFDGIELHGAHGYLIDQFFWEVTNKRNDEYGGDIGERAKFAADVVRACRKEVGSDFPIVFRYSQWKGTDYQAKLAKNSNELEQLLTPLVEAGVDIFHCSTRRIWEPEFIDEDPSLNLAGWTKRITKKPTIAVGSVGINRAYLSNQDNAHVTIVDNLKIIDEKIKAGEFDYVAIGRALLADSEWAVKLKNGQLDQVVHYTKESEKYLI